MQESIKAYAWKEEFGEGGRVGVGRLDRGCSSRVWPTKAGFVKFTRSCRSDGLVRV